MKIGFASSNPSFSRPVLAELSTRGHQIIHYQHSADPRQNAFQVGRLKGLCDRIFVDFAQDPLLPIVHEPSCPITVRMHRIEVYNEQNYVLAGDHGQEPFPWHNVTHLVFVAQHVKDRFLEIANQRGVPLPNSMPIVEHVGVDCEKFGFVKRDWSKPPFSMVVAGNLIPKKRQYTLLEMFADAEDRWPGMFGLKILGSTTIQGYGNSEYHANCSDALLRLKLTDKVATSPNVPHDAMPAQYADAAFVVNASNEEGCATTVGEGMATGCLPLVAHWRGSDTLYPKTGLWDTPGGFMRLLEEFVELTPKQRERRSKAARAWVKKRFDMGHIARQMADLIQGQSKSEFYDGFTQHWREQRDNPRQVAQGEWLASEVRPYTRMLEVGCALGRQCELAKRLGAERVVGVDISRNAIFEAISNAQTQGLDLEYGLIDEKGELPPGPYNLVACFDVLEHVHPSEWHGFLSRIASVTEPGGKLLLAFPYRAQIHDGGFQVEEYVVYPKIIRQMLEDLGYTVAMSPFGAGEEEFRMEAVKQ